MPGISIRYTTASAVLHLCLRNPDRNNALRILRVFTTDILDWSVDWLCGKLLVYWALQWPLDCLIDQYKMGSQSRGPERGISPWRLHLSSYIILFVILEGVTVADASGFSGIPGEYCATRTPSCCTARNDKCAVSLLGTECYCDDFCDRREGEQIPDCCPDFYKHCRGESADTATTEAWTQPPTRTPVEIPVIEKGLW
jgi:hypothetical protein